MRCAHAIVTVSCKAAQLGEGTLELLLQTQRVLLVRATPANERECKNAHGADQQ